jgi:uncharacterized protein (TIGR00297 family)
VLNARPIVAPLAFAAAVVVAWNNSSGIVGSRPDGRESTGRQVISLHQAGALPAAIVSVTFAVLARALGSVTDGGALIGAFVAFLLMYAAGLWAFFPLFAVLLMTMLATRWRADRKSKLGVAERAGGRNARQVLANLGAAGLCALAAAMFGRQSTLLMVGAAAVLAEAAADTVSSEVGQALATQPRLILGFAPVPSGTNGAISLEGTFAGCIAAGLVASTASLAGVMPWRWAPIVGAAGVAGMLLDSVLGASFENRGDMGNDSVNFVSTVFAADVALVAAFLLRHR